MEIRSSDWIPEDILKQCLGTFKGSRKAKLSDLDCWSWPGGVNVGHKGWEPVGCAVKPWRVGVGGGTYDPVALSRSVGIGAVSACRIKRVAGV